MATPFDPYHKWLSIPPKDQPPHHYRLLGVDLFEDDPDVIEAAADQRMAHLRTYQTGPRSELSQKLLSEVAAARVCLLDAQKKAAYDARLRQAIEARKQKQAVHRPLPWAVPLATAVNRQEPLTHADATPASAAVAGKRPIMIWPFVAAGVAGGLALVMLVGLFVWQFGSGDTPPDGTAVTESLAANQAGRTLVKEPADSSRDAPAPIAPARPEPPPPRTPEPKEERKEEETQPAEETPVTTVDPPTELERTEPEPVDQPEPAPPMVEPATGGPPDADVLEVEPDEPKKRVLTRSA